MCYYKATQKPSVLLMPVFFFDRKTRRQSYDQLIMIPARRYVHLQMHFVVATTDMRSRVMPDTFREAKKIRSKKKERPFRRERAAYLAGGSARQVAANHELGSTSRPAHSPRAIGKNGHELSPSSSSLSAVDSGGAPPTCAGRANLSHTPAASSRTFRAPRSHERAPRSRTFHSPPDQSRTEVKLVFSAAAPPLSRG